MQNLRGRLKLGTRRKFILRALLLLICLALAALVWWRTHPPYAPSSSDEVHYSPDRRFFVEIFHGQIDGGSARVSDGWRAESVGAYHSVGFFSWTPDSRYAVLSSFGHYGLFDLNIFDTRDWSWHAATYCDMFAGNSSGCNFESPLATNGRYLLLAGGVMLDLTGDLPPYIQGDTGWIGAYPEQAVWSFSNTWLAVVANDANHNHALYIGHEAGGDLHPVMPLDPNLQVTGIHWTPDDQHIEVSGTLNKKSVISVFDMSNFSPARH